MVRQVTTIVTALIVILLTGVEHAGHAQPPAPAAPSLHGWVTPPADAVRTRQVIFHSDTVGRSVSYHIYTPNAYDAEPDRRFPVIYWLHGSGGGLGGVAPLARHFDQAIHSGLVPPLLVVFPNGLPQSLWVDSKGGRVPMETVVIKELLPHVDSNFRTIASRRGRVVEGFSMGGYGAARFGIKFHEVFGAASVLAGGPFHPDFGHAPAVGPEGRERVLQRVFGGDIEYYAALSPARLAEQYADAVRGSLLLRIVVGNLDVTAQLNREFSTHLTALDIPHTFTEVPDVGHQTMPLLRALGDDNWAFYRAAMDGIAEDVNPAP